MNLISPIEIGTNMWLSQIPGSWKIVQFKHVFQIVKESSKDEMPQVLSLTQSGVIERDITNNEGQLSQDYTQSQSVKTGDFLLNPMDLISGWVAISAFSGVTSNAYFVFRPQQGRGALPFSPKFFEYVLQMYYKSKILDPFGKGVGRPENGGGRWTLNRETINSIPLPVPPIDEQKMIADFLDRELAQIDALIAKQEKLVELSRSRRYSAISRLLRLGSDVYSASKSSGLEWLGDVSTEAKLIRLRFLAKVETGFGDTQDANPDGEFNFYVRSDKIERSDSFDFIGPAVLTSGDGAGVGKVYHLANGKFKAHQRCYVMKDFSGISAEYFYWYFSTFFINEVNPGTAKSTVESLRRPMLTNFPILVHSSESEGTLVKQIGDIAAKSDAIVSKAEEVIEELRERRHSLISAAVTGKIDTRKAA